MTSKRSVTGCNCTQRFDVSGTTVSSLHRLHPFHRLLLLYMFPTFPPENRAFLLSSGQMPSRLIGPIWLSCPVLWSGKEEEARVFRFTVLMGNICMEEEELFTLSQKVWCLDQQTGKKWGTGETVPISQGQPQIGTKVSLWYYVGCEGIYMCVYVHYI